MRTLTFRTCIVSPASPVPPRARTPSAGVLLWSNSTGRRRKTSLPLECHREPTTQNAPVQARGVEPRPAEHSRTCGCQFEARGILSRPEEHCRGNLRYCMKKKDGLAAAKKEASRIKLDVQGCGVVRTPMHAFDRSALLLPPIHSQTPPIPRDHAAPHRHQRRRVHSHGGPRTRSMPSRSRRRAGAAIQGPENVLQDQEQPSYTAE
jgi:hypothetical protein